MGSYFFGAGGFKLGERVEILTTRQRGILIAEVVHISGCNTYQVFLPNVFKDDKPVIKHCDYLVLRRLEEHEAVFGNEDNLSDDTVFSPKGTDVNVEWIQAALKAQKEPIPETDAAVGVEEIMINPGTEVWHKVYNIPMLVSYIYREINSKELEYGLTYMIKDKEVSVNARAYTLIPMEVRINVYPGDKTGPVFDDCHAEMADEITLEDFARF